VARVVSRKVGHWFFPELLVNLRIQFTPHRTRCAAITNTNPLVLFTEISLFIVAVIRTEHLSSLFEQVVDTYRYLHALTGRNDCDFVGSNINFSAEILCLYGLWYIEDSSCPEYGGTGFLRNVVIICQTTRRHTQKAAALTFTAMRTSEFRKICLFLFSA
jgi:hypothetical protein